MEPLIIIGLFALGIWIFWKSRKIIWFLLLFLGALIVLVSFNIGMFSLKVDYPWLEPTLITIGIIIAAFKFAKKRS